MCHVVSHVVRVISFASNKVRLIEHYYENSPYSRPGPLLIRDISEHTSNSFDFLHRNGTREMKGQAVSCLFSSVPVFSCYGGTRISHLVSSVKRVPK